MTQVNGTKNVKRSKLFRLAETESVTERREEKKFWQDTVKVLGPERKKRCWNTEPVLVSGGRSDSLRRPNSPTDHRHLVSKMV